MPIFFAEREVDGTVLIGLTTIEAHIFTKSLKYKITLRKGEGSFLGHGAVGVKGR